MKKLKSLTDLQYVLNQKCDVYDSQCNRIPFIRFVSMPLINIINSMNDVPYYYQLEQ